jgi:hypothetical protein
MWGVGDRLVQLVAVSLLILGVAAIVRSRPWHLSLLVGPGVLLVISAVVHLYPFDPWAGGRLVLFLLPASCILVAVALASVLRLTPRPASTVQQAALASGVLVVTLVFCGRGLSSMLTNRELPTLPREEVRELIAGVLLPQLQRGDSIYVYHGALDAFEYYAPELRDDTKPPYGVFTLSSRAGVTIAYGGDHVKAPNDYGEELRSTANRQGSSRLWIVFSHVYLEREEDVLTSLIPRYATLERVWRQPGAALYLVRTEPS